MDITITKVVVLVLLGMIKLVSGLAPLVFTKLFKRRSERFLKKFIGKLNFILDLSSAFSFFRNCLMLWRRCLTFNGVHPHGGRSEGIFGEGHHHGYDP